MINEFLQRPSHEVTEVFQFLVRVNLTHVDCGKDTQGNLTKLIINVLKRIGGKSDFLTQVRHLHLILEGGVTVTVVDVHQYRRPVSAPSPSGDPE